jgi:hypothetical protein
MNDKQLEQILQEEPDEAKVWQAVKEYRKAHMKSQENKQLICDLLCAALKATRDQQDLQSLTYHYNGPDDQMVTIAWSEYGKSVNVSADSGIVMIRDILKALR